MVANPPFSYRWEPSDALTQDLRFKNHGLAPKSAADFAFLLHGFHYLAQEGSMAIISTAVSDEEINLAAVNTNLLEIEQKIKAATEKHNKFLKELGLPYLPE